ncbi:MAG TPA: alpha/beta hydrolase-fold protein [Flavobacteriales bacterium]|nr:alpha/beta hydrolase-fold protein [Flavobacteriales bacterium]
MQKHWFSLAVVAQLFLIGPNVAQVVQPFVFGEVHHIRSKTLGVDRVLNVYFPDGYSPDSARTYPVIYVLDGSSNEDFPHIAGLAQFMNMYDLLPKSIVVGIANGDRRHDFTAPTKNDSDKVWVPESGGSAAFITFISDELIPFVTAHFKVNGHRTIIGQSLGGLLCMQMLFERPDLFDDHVIVSPSLWWDDGSLAAKAEAWAQRNGALNERVFIAMGNNDDIMGKQVDAVVKAFEAHTKNPFLWHYEFFPEETHATILHRAVYRGFDWLRTGK